MKIALKLFSVAAAASIVGILALISAEKPRETFTGTGEANTYTIKMDGTHGTLSTSVAETNGTVKTELGNDISIKYANYKNGSGWGTLSSSGYVANITPISGIIGISIGIASGSGAVSVEYFGTQWATQKKVAWETIDSAVSEAGTIILNPVKALGCEHFKLNVDSEFAIDTITVKYTCTEPNLYYGETGYLAGSESKQTKDGSDIYLSSTKMARLSSESMILKDIPVEATHYSVEATYCGNSGVPVNREIDYGIVAYYLDAENYLVIESQYRNWDRPNEIRSFVLTGRIGGNVYLSDDDWSDGNSIAPNVGGTLKAEITISSVSGTSVGYTFNSGTYSKIGSFSAPSLKTKPNKIGLHCYNDVMKSTDVVFVKLADPREEVPCEFDGLLGTPSLKQYSTGEIVYSGGGWLSSMAGKNVANGSSYTVSADLSGTITKAAECYMGLLAYYYNDANYLVAYMGYSLNDRPHEIRSIQCTGFMGGNWVGWINDFWCDGSNCLPNVLRTFSVTTNVTPTAINISFNLAVSNGFSKSGNWSVNGSGIQPATKAGLWCQGDIITYTNVAIS